MFGQSGHNLATIPDKSAMSDKIRGTVSVIDGAASGGIGSFSRLLNLYNETPARGMCGGAGGDRSGSPEEPAPSAGHLNTSDRIMSRTMDPRGGVGRNKSCTSQVIHSPPSMGVICTQLLLFGFLPIKCGSNSTGCPLQTRDVDPILL